MEFVVQYKPQGSPGANFLVRWAGSGEIDEPLMDPIMIGQTSNVGISFTSFGRVVRDVPPAVSAILNLDKRGGRENHPKPYLCAVHSTADMDKSI